MVASNQYDFKESPLPIPTWQPDPQHNEVSSLGIGLVTGTIAFFILGICALFYLRRADQRRRTAHANAMLRRIEEGQPRDGRLARQQPPDHARRNSVLTWKIWRKLKHTLSDTKDRSNDNGTKLGNRPATNVAQQAI